MIIQLQVSSLMNEELKLIAPLEPLTMKEHGSDESTPVNIKENHKCRVNLKAFASKCCQMVGVFSPVLRQ